MKPYTPENFRSVDCLFSKYEINFYVEKLLILEITVNSVILYS